MFPSPVPIPSPFDLIARRQRRETIKGCLERLPREHVTIIRMRYYRDLQFSDIARVLQSSEHAVVQTHGRVLENMRDQLKTAGVRNLHDL
jgi:DNA-directed RNA polymerase specialized sigma24 family protein